MENRLQPDLVEKQAGRSILCNHTLPPTVINVMTERLSRVMETGRASGCIVENRIRSEASPQHQLPAASHQQQTRPTALNIGPYGVSALHWSKASRLYLWASLSFYNPSVLGSLVPGFPSFVVNDQFLNWALWSWTMNMMRWEGEMV